jgi:diguanylate cyclase (GGDEF)-like protein
MHRLWRALGLFVLLLSATLAGAQQPLLTKMAPDLRVYPQFFSIAQAERGDLYVGGLDGLLRFDGGRWRWYALPKPGALRALHFDRGGRLWVGGTNCFGYMQRNGSGEETFVDLSGGFASQLKGRQFADIWRIAELDGEIYFVGLHDLFLVKLDGTPLRHWQHEGRFGAIAAVDGSIWVQWRGEGLKRRIDGEFQMLPGGKRYAQHLIYNLVVLEDKQVLVHDVAPSLALWRDGQFEDLSRPIDRAQLEPLGLGIRLRDGDIAFAGSDGTMRVLDVAASALESITISKNFLVDLLQGQDGSLFVLEIAGLSRLEWPQRWRMFGTSEGVETGIYQVNEIGNAVFLSTWSGAYRAEISPERVLGPFALQPWTGNEAWATHAHAGQLLFADSRRLMQIDGTTITAISGDDLYPRLMVDDPYQSDWVWIGTEHGPAVFEQTAQGYRQRARDYRVGWLINSMVAFDEWMWLGSESEGLMRVRHADVVAGRMLATPAGIDLGLPAGSGDPALVSQIDQTLWVSTRRGLYRYEAGRFVADPMKGLGGLLAEGEIVALRQAPDGSAWAFSFHSIYRRENGADWHLALLGGLHTGAIFDLKAGIDGEAFVGSESGLLQHRAARSAEVSNGIPLVVPRVTSVRLIRGRGNSQALDLKARPEFRLNGGSLEFEFGFPAFDGVGANDFQFRLEGHSPTWSDWSNRASATFLALQPGDYQLRLRARRRFGAPVEGEAFAFVIVPRWHERAWVLPLAIVLVGGLIALALIQRQRLKVRRLRTLNAELDRMVRERTRDLESANVQLRSLADSDGLTGLANRRHFDHVLVEALLRAQNQQQPLALLMLDVDHFKQFNDTHGHQAGDDVLRAVATQMREAVRTDTLVARYGGEEFAVIVPNCDARHAQEIAERIRVKVAARLSGVTVSIGIAVNVPGSLANAEDLVAQADAALYRAKRRGRDCVECDAPAPA